MYFGLVALPSGLQVTKKPADSDCASSLFYVWLYKRIFYSTHKKFKKQFFIIYVSFFITFKLDINLQYRSAELSYV